ncbi:efflux RND transporter periplasmic adaptor subunit [Serpentinicella alkaliphila]|uniref:HlyD family secretion protein n=1 Tax=Serpentinicella alkaliphila TaxID=1734049 RepID=A0A4R2TEB6_9FIRM|nr:efflux RND transporter periplasmic adaptor subunit [Serpentinicella alkaliphila]QUH24886.1 efflux RND transporter periplasmic adaptor subunit [Serpentinicella alkaliphila]TCQ01840.1 HlyD family secretion protein [Serpentinicella alkaliphila]
MERNKKKKFIYASICIVIVLIASLGMVYSSKNNQKLVSVTAKVVETGDIVVRVPANGVIEEVNRHLVVHESVAKVLSVEVKEGESVVEGQVLAHLEPNDVSVRKQIKESQLAMEKLDLEKLENTRERTRINLSRAKTEAKETAERSKALYEAGAISKIELNKSIEALENAEREYLDFNVFRDGLSIDIEKMKRKIDVTKLEIKELEKEQQRAGTLITSPINGIVTKVNLERGMTVSPTNPSFIISDLSELKIEINVSEYDISKVKVGQLVEINSDAIGDGTLFGEVEKIAPVATRIASGQVNETVVPVTIKVDGTHEGVKPGFSVRTRIVSEQKENVIIVPFDTIVSEQNGAKIVWIVTPDNILKRVEVQTGIESDFEIEIISGINKGDTVVLNPSSNLKEDIKVNVNLRD